MNIFKKQLIANHYLFFFFLAIILRLWLVFQPGHPYDLQTFSAWGHLLNRLSPPTFLHRIWSDYLPLPLLLLKIIAQLSTFFSLPFSLVWKFWLVLVELFLLHFIIQHLPSPRSLLPTLLLLFSPPLLINGALWGQIDGLVSLFLLTSFLASLPNYRRPFLSLFTFTLAFSLKPLVILAFPFLLLNFPSLSLKLYLSLGFGFLSLLPATFFLSSLNPVSLFLFFWRRLLFQASVYPYTTINAFNFWSIKGHFWQPDTFSVLGLNAHLVGLTFFLLVFLFLFYRALNSNQPYVRSYLASLVLIGFYLFATRMHERHLIYGLHLFLLSSFLPSLSFFSLINFSFFSFVFSLNNLLVLTAPQFSLQPQFLFHFLSFFLVSYYLFILIFSSLARLSLAPLLSFVRHPLTFLFIFAFILRFFHLSFPQRMIFDEVYHAFTARQFARGDNLIAWEWWHRAPSGYAYEWTHPPLAKYGMVLGMLIFGQNSLGWRFFSALLGSLSLCLFYRLARLWSFSSRTALLATFLLAIDGLHLVQSRIAMNDIYLLFFIFLTLYFASRQRWSITFFVFGLALASKWSAIFLLLPLAYLFFTTAQPLLPRLLSWLRYLLIAGLTYLLAYTPFFVFHSFSQFIQLQRQMWLYHTHLQATHPYQSTPWQWIWGSRPVWYFTSHHSHLLANIYAQSNPLTLTFALLSLLFLPLVWRSRLTLPLLTYLSFLLPWLHSPRIMFFYHYLPSLSFLYLIFAFILTRLPSKLTYFFLFFLLVTTLIFVFPSVYGFFLPSSYWNFLFKLFPLWQ